eukprot:6179708-Pleurochrysis_carterae.AAC.1
MHETRTLPVQDCACPVAPSRARRNSPPRGRRCRLREQGTAPRASRVRQQHSGHGQRQPPTTCAAAPREAAARPLRARGSQLPTPGQRRSEAPSPGMSRRPRSHLRRARLSARDGCPRPSHCPRDRYEACCQSQQAGSHKTLGAARRLQAGYRARCSPGRPSCIPPGGRMHAQRMACPDYTVGDAHRGAGSRLESTPDERWGERTHLWAGSVVEERG